MDEDANHGTAVAHKHTQTTTASLTSATKSEVTHYWFLQNIFFFMNNVQFNVL